MAVSVYYNLNWVLIQSVILAIPACMVMDVQARWTSDICEVCASGNGGRLFLLHCMYSFATSWCYKAKKVTWWLSVELQI